MLRNEIAGLTTTIKRFWGEEKRMRPPSQYVLSTEVDGQHNPFCFPSPKRYLGLSEVS